MILVFFITLKLIITIIFIAAILLIVLLMSNIRIKIKNFKIINFKLYNDYKIIIELCFLNRFKYLSINFDKAKINKIIHSKSFDKLKDMEMPSNKEVINNIEKLKIKIEKIELSIRVGLQEANITSILVTIIQTIVNVLQARFVPDIANAKCDIKPVYNKDTIIISFNSIFNIKIVHIMYVIFSIRKKGRDKNGRSSNRRTYAYSHGFD